MILSKKQPTQTHQRNTGESKEAGTGALKKKEKCRLKTLTCTGLTMDQVQSEHAQWL